MVTSSRCSHDTNSTVLLRLSWCTRCSGWQYRRSSEELGSLWGDCFSAPVMEFHFLPAETTDPEEMIHLVTRAFRAAQEMEQDIRNQ